MVGQMKFDNRKVARRNDGLTERMVAADLQNVNLSVYKPNLRLKMFPPKNAQFSTILNLQQSSVIRKVHKIY